MTKGARPGRRNGGKRWEWAGNLCDSTQEDNFPRRDNGPYTCQLRAQNL